MSSAPGRDVLAQQLPSSRKQTLPPLYAHSQAVPNAAPAATYSGAYPADERNTQYVSYSAPAAAGPPLASASPGKHQHQQHKISPTPAPPVVVVTAAPNGGVPGESYTNRAERLVRLGFIRKVYALLIMQLVTTFAFVAIFTFVPSVKHGVQERPGVLWAAIVLSIAFLVALSCFPTIAKRWPVNLCCLAGFTLTEGYLVGAIASYSSSDAVILAVGGTVLLVFSLTLFAWQARIDFTALTTVLFVVLWTLIFFAIVVAIAPTLIFRTIYASLGVLFFGLFLVYDTQMVIGRGALSFGIDDAISAALMLYIDILQMFLCLLSLFGARD